MLYRKMLREIEMAKDLKPVEDYVYPGWLFNLDIFKGAKERSFSGYPTFYVMQDTIAAGAFQEYSIQVEENEIWFIEAIVHGDILPDIFNVTITVDDQPVMPRQLLMMTLMDLSFPSPFPSVGRVYLKIENSSSHSASYEAILWYRTFTRTTLNRIFEFLGMERL